MGDASDDLFDQLAGLPRDVGWALLIAGLATEAGMPGVPPVWLAGVLILWPRTGRRLTRPLRRRFPAAFRGAAALVTRYAADLASRYPVR